jgi:hypothetical protein
MNDPLDNYVRLDVYSGVFYLQSSLVGTSFTTLIYSVSAISGLLQSSVPFILTITVSDNNVYAATFESHIYYILANESMTVGTALIQLYAHDIDSPVLGYSIVDGDPSGRFTIDSLTGTASADTGT